MVEYVSAHGPQVCSTCGYCVDESGRVKVQPNRRTRLLERRVRKLNEFGIFGDINTSLLSAITEEEEQGIQVREAMGVRGLTSIEASVIKETKDRPRRAISMGYTCVEDRYIPAMWHFAIGCMKRADHSVTVSMTISWHMGICRIHPGHVPN